MLLFLQSWGRRSQSHYTEVAQGGVSSQSYDIKLPYNTQPILIFNRENLQNSESPNGPRRGLDFIALGEWTLKFDIF